MKCVRTIGIVLYLIFVKKEMCSILLRNLKAFKNESTRYHLLNQKLSFKLHFLSTHNFTAMRHQLFLILMTVIQTTIKSLSEMYECLNVNFDNYLQIVSRKGKAEERRPLLILFSADAMACMFHAAGVASEKALDEKHYLFLKKLTQVCKLIYGQFY